MYVPSDNTMSLALGLTCGFCVLMQSIPKLLFSSRTTVHPARYMVKSNLELNMFSQLMTAPIFLLDRSHSNSANIYYSAICERTPQMVQGKNRDHQQQRVFHPENSPSMDGGVPTPYGIQGLGTRKCHREP